MFGVSVLFLWFREKGLRKWHATDGGSAFAGHPFWSFEASTIFHSFCFASSICFYQFELGWRLDVTISGPTQGWIEGLDLFWAVGAVKEQSY